MRGTLDDLSRLYAKYKIYPGKRFHSTTPVRVFQDMRPQDHFAIEVERILRDQTYAPERRGADLPYWGKAYFGPEPGKRIFVVGQDSTAKDAGSVVLWAHMPPSEPDYKEYFYGQSSVHIFRSQSQSHNAFIDWGLNFDFTFITDASKVYRQYPNDQFDRDASAKLLRGKIALCAPDLLILLGAVPLSLLQRAGLLDPGIAYSTTVEAGEYLSATGVKTVVAPFPTGQGLTQANFQARKETAKRLIRATLRG